MVTVYSKNSCINCEATKRYLKKHDIEFEVVMIDQDPSLVDQIKQWGFHQVPVVVSPEGEKWSGFRPDMMKALKPERMGVPANNPAFA